MTKLIDFLLRIIASVAVPLVAMGAGSRSPDWDDVRGDWIKDNDSCAACGTRIHLEVHHVVPYSVDPSRELDRKNLITLCRSCHLTFGHLRCFTSWNPSVREDAAKFLVQVKNRPHLKEAKNGK